MKVFIHYLLSYLSKFLLEQDAHLPINDDDEMDIYLNLEEDTKPQHSSDSSKKRRLEEGEELFSSFTYLWSCQESGFLGCTFGIMVLLL